MPLSRPMRASPGAPPDATADVIVVGPGAAGLTLAIALARKGFAAVLLGAPDTRPNARTAALFDGSIALLRALRLWDEMAPHAAPLRTIRLVDDTGSLFRLPPTDFHSSEIDLGAFGYNIENRTIVEKLAAAARATPGLELVEVRARDFDFGRDAASVRTEDGRVFRAPLLVAADGSRSSVRSAAGIGVSQTEIRQSALTVLIAHRLPHHDVSTEFHTRGGPFTLVPLAGTEAAPNRSSLVWLMRPEEARRRASLDDTALAAAIERQSHALFGEVRIEGPRGLFPMMSMTARRLTAPRLALIGEAAHVFPPIGAQGLNLGLRDVAQLVERLLAARRRATDIGSTSVLAEYEAERMGDILLRSVAVDVLGRSLLAPIMPVDLLRGAGLLSLATFGPLRRALMRGGVGRAAAMPHWVHA